ncbi:hypothetical protein ScPMuIL_018741 [Solemya velum]
MSAAAEFKKIAGKEQNVGAQFFLKAFKLPGVQDAFSQFKGKNVSEADLLTHGGIVIAFLKDKVAGGSGVDGFVSSHKQKAGVTIELINAAKGSLVDTFAEAGMDRAVMDKFVGDFLGSVSGKW